MKFLLVKATPRGTDILHQLRISIWSCLIFLAGGVYHAHADVRLAVVADPHAWPSETGYYQNFQEVIAHVNRVQVDQVLIAGDLTYSGEMDQYDLFNTQIAQFSAPTLSVAGNHDVGNKISPVTSNGVTDARLDRYQSNVGPLYYSETIAPNYRVVGATSSLLGSGLAREISQWTFLEEQLVPASADETVILLMHYPAFRIDVNEQPHYSNLDPGPRAQLLQLLEDNDVEYMITGHLHRPLLNTWNDITMLTAPAVSFSASSSTPEGWTLLTIHDDGSFTEEIQFFPLPPFRDADFDDDGETDGRDFLIWQRGFNRSGTNRTGDANADRFVDGFDLDVWQDLYRSVGGLDDLVSVPEPTSCTLLTNLFLICVCSYRRFRNPISL